MSTAVIIPARYASTRFPGKIISELNNKPIIQWVYERAIKTTADSVFVATDDQRIVDVVESFGGQSIMTSTDHTTGTDRIWEAVQSVDADIIINVQGDEPLIPTEVISELIAIMESDSSIKMATVAVACNRDDVADNPNVVKVVFDNNNYALYFSRSIIPMQRVGGVDTPVYRHWGIYAYRRETLESIVSFPPGRLEQCEMLEQLRVMENGIRIKIIISDIETIGIDTPEDLVEAEAYIKKHSITN
jgi:3-deoxy-manno-octulosonate cytidylyltransferase (CMP-KDO synthetase)